VIGRILAIAINTFREAARNKVLYSLLFFAVLIIASALVLGQMSLHEEARITRDVGLGGIALFGVLIAIFVGVNLVYKELDRKTVFLLVPKPLYRHELILGKYAGMALTLGVQVGIMALVLFAVLALQGFGLDEGAATLRAIILTLLEVLVVTAIAVLFSSFSTPFLSGAFTFGLFVVGRSLPELRELLAKLAEPAVRIGLGALLRLLPDLHLFALSGSMLDGQRVSVHGTFVGWGYVGSAALYAGLYVALLLSLASLLFSRRDFV
jgi:ABC-type transport system involved in multi-copper enzyme maturation permease subunit